MSKINFEELKTENEKLYLTNGKIDLEDDCLILNDIIFKNIFKVDSDGFSSQGTVNLIQKIGHENDSDDWSLKNHTSEDHTKHGTNFYNDLSIIKFIYCEFEKEPILSSTKFNIIYFYDCIFKGSIEKLFKNYPDTEISFDNCQFDTIRFNQYGEKDNMKKFKLYGGKIKELNIFNNTINDKFYINKQYDNNDKITTINKLIIQNTIFKENFKLHNCLVYEIKIKDTDFNKNADFYKSEFKAYLSKVGERNEDKTIYFSALNFRSLALFGECVFEERCSFKYVTFEGYSHFRGTIFKKGLDLDYTNIQKEMNFFDIIGLDSTISKEHTSQETYRIIKHNFKKIGNQIEANKYHNLELLTHNKNTWAREDVTLSLLSDGVISFLNLITSYFSKYWMLPLIWIFVVGVISANVLGDVTLANIIKYATITQYEDLKGHATLFLFNKASLGFLYYQFIQSIRKNTKN